MGTLEFKVQPDLINRFSYQENEIGNNVTFKIDQERISYNAQYYDNPYALSCEQVKDFYCYLRDNTPHLQDVFEEDALLKKHVFKLKPKIDLSQTSIDTIKKEIAKK